ncbi:DUF2092 domain-containing protein [Algoriphagus namhaensis]
MKKRFIAGLLCLLIFSESKSQEVQIDTTALVILDNMSQLFGELKSVGFTSHLSRDAAFSNEANIKEFVTTTSKITGPNKFSTRIKGESKEEMYKYDGDKVYFYSFTHNFYSIADAPDNLIETIDWLYTSFGIELTAADILYPSFSKDLAENMNLIQYVGKVELMSKPTYHILAMNETISVQLWISDDEYLLPAKVILTYLDRPHAPQFEVDFSDWELNHDYPTSIYDFTPPPSSRQITWIQSN